METTRIAKVRIIKASDKLPQPIVVIDLANGKPSIVRNQAQFLIDCEESGLLVGNVHTLQNPQIAKLKNHLVGGTVMGDFSYRKAGDKYVVTEFSRVITDKTHPKFGTVSVGATQIAEKDRTNVEGFLTLQRPVHIEQMYINATVKAQEDLALSGAFDGIISAKSAETDENFDADDLPLEAIDEAIGSTPKAKK
jgi:hypothetical protein